MSFRFFNSLFIAKRLKSFDLFDFLSSHEVMVTIINGFRVCGASYQSYISVLSYPTRIICLDVRTASRWRRMVTMAEVRETILQKGLSEWWNEETEHVFQRIERWATSARGYNRLQPLKWETKTFITFFLVSMHFLSEK